MALRGGIGLGAGGGVVDLTTTSGRRLARLQQ